MAPHTKFILTLEEVAAELHSSPETVSAWIKHRGLPAAKPGRSYLILRDDLIEWLRKQAAMRAASKACSASGKPVRAVKDGELDAALARSPKPA